MKTLKQHIDEALKIGKNLSEWSSYSCQPKTKDEFVKFIKDFANDNDVYREKRHWVCDQMYKYKDANSCERIVKLSEMSL